VSRLEDDGSLTQILETDDISTIVFLWGGSADGKGYSFCFNASKV
jgi:hypothetical protein